LIDVERQKFLLDLLRKAIVEFEYGQIPLDELSSDLKSLINNLDDVSDHVWVARLRWRWLKIETVNASRIDHRQEILAQTDDKEVESSLKEILSLIDSAPSVEDGPE
jgi:hypothetical protein